MSVIKVKNTRIANVKRRINDLKVYLKNDAARDAYMRTEQKLQTRWKLDIPRIFNVRSSAGYRCDGILAKSLGIVIRGKNSIVIYVEPIVRFSKNAMSSGGAVNNLTSILFRGSRASFGAYYPRWDARVQKGMHPGTSPSPMRNYWKLFIKYARIEIRKAINKGMKKKLGLK
ncbi:MAG: hypothetical protein WC998_07100 [Candidatus Paceibacterota bacterium]|jgi:hypothetical protein